jgi:phospholipid/cholesterol/gamma-HCH transport system substrate-binding protein
MQRMDDTATNLNQTISDVRRLVLNEETLTNLSATVLTMRAASERAMATVEQINLLLVTNGPVVSSLASNLSVVSEDLKRFAGNLNGLLETNSDSIGASVKNIESSTLVLKNILNDTQSGKGLAGSLLRNEELSADVAGIVQNLSITSSNLNRHGLWRVLWGSRPAKNGAATADKLPSPKDAQP